MLKFLKTFALLLTTLLVLTQPAWAQTKKRKYRSKQDSLRAAIHSRDSLLRGYKKVDTTINGVLKKIEDYNLALNDVKANLNRTIDTTELGALLPKLEARLSTIRGLINNDRSGTLRYLYAIRGFLNRINEQLDVNQDQLKEINERLLQNQSELEALAKDRSINILPTDTVLRETFLMQKEALYLKWEKLDSTNKKLILKIGHLQNRITAVYIAILDETDRINLKIKDFSIRAFTGEYDKIWKMRAEPKNSFREAWDKTVTMNKRLFNFFIGRDVLIHLAGAILFGLFFMWIFTNRAKIKRLKDIPENVLNQTRYVVSHPVLSSFIVAFVIIPNFYDHPPIVFLEAFFVVLMVSVLWLARYVCIPPVFSFLHQLFWITILYSISNLFIQVSDVDRIAILILAAVSVVLSVRFLKRVSEVIDGLPPYTRVIVRIFIVLQGLSFLCNVFGRFSLAKILGVTGVYNLWLALALHFMVQIIMEALFLQLEANKSKNSFTAYIDFKLLRDKFRNILNVIAVVLWLIMLSQNLDIEDAAYKYISEFLSSTHQIGSTGTSFTFQSIIIFIIVIWLSVIISKIISYLYEIAGKQDFDLYQKKNRTSTLLIRIGIITIGFLLAVAASNFPLDKLTIIISAFGVGIGFGLQNIVNNLVSGLILAFEKPVQIGDIIEVDGRSGTIKEIGIRSSKIATADGSEVIVPNGDLISRHVINWTLSNDNRRVELIISVAYGTDIEKAQGLLQDILLKREDVMPEPQPLVFVFMLNQNSVDFRLLFWADDITHWQELKSKVLTDIYNKFNAEGIEIPFQQRDVHLHLPSDQQLGINLSREENKPEEPTRTSTDKA